MTVSKGKGVGSGGLNPNKGVGSASVRAIVEQIIEAGGAAVAADIAASLPALTAGLDAKAAVKAVITATLPAIQANVEAGMTVKAAIAASLPSLTAAAVLVLTDAIQAVIFDGATDYGATTSAPAGVSAVSTPTFVWSGRFNSDGSRMDLFNVPSALSVYRDTSNQINVEGSASAMVFQNQSTAIPQDNSYLLVAADASGHSSTLKVATTATTFTGTPVTGSSVNLDLGKRWTYGVQLASANVAVTSGASGWLDGRASMYWVDDAQAGLAASVSVEEWWDTSADALRDPGVSGTNATGSSPLVLLAQDAANWATNRGTGQDLDAASNSGDDTSPGTYQPDYAPRTGEDVLNEAVAWWDASDASNTKADTDTTFDVLADLTGNGHDITAIGATTRPLVGTVNSLDAADFDGSNDRMDTSGATTALKDNFNAGGTWVAVIQPDSDGGGNFSRVWSKTNNEAVIAFGEDTGAVKYEFSWVMDGSNIGTVDTTDTISFASPIVLDSRYDKSTAAVANVVVGNDNTDLTTGNGGLTIVFDQGTTPNTSGELIVGNRNDNIRGFDGKLCEMAFWDSELSNADMLLVRQHLADKWGVTLS